MIKVQHSIKKALDKLNRVEKSQVSFALSVAINDTAKEAVEDIKTEMKSVFDTPVRWTLNAFFVKRGTKRKPVAVIRRKDAQRGRHYLEVQSKGGARPQTGLEKGLGSRLAYAGIVRTVTPTSKARKTKAGNWSPAQRNQVLSGIKAQRDPTANTTKASKKRNKSRAGYFVPRPGSKLSPGVYQRKSRKKIVKILHFSDGSANYKKRLDIAKVTRTTVERRFDQNFRAALKRAVSTAR